MVQLAKKNAVDMCWAPPETKRAIYEEIDPGWANIYDVKTLQMTDQAFHLENLSDYLPPLLVGDDRHQH